MRTFLVSGYFAATLKYPAATLAAIAVLVAAFGAFMGRLEGTAQGTSR